MSIRVGDIKASIQTLLGACDDVAIYERLTEAVEVLANKSNFDPLLGTVDLVTTASRYVTLPNDVETPLALNIGGRPTFARDRWASYHLNGRGDTTNQDVTWAYDDKGDHPTFRDLDGPARLVVQYDLIADATVSFRVNGIDQNDEKVYSIVTGNPQEGLLYLPTASAVNPVTGQIFKRITSVQKGESDGYLTLWAFPTDGISAVYAVGRYEPFDLVPKYRRLILSRSADWVRLEYRKKTFKVRSDEDLLPLHSRMAVRLMCKALKKYDEDNFDDGLKYEQKAIQFLVEEQISRSPPASPSLQINTLNAVVDPSDRMD
jgi:hypothetical protein